MIGVVCEIPCCLRTTLERVPFHGANRFRIVEPDSHDVLVVIPFRGLHHVGPRIDSEPLELL